MDYSILDEAALFRKKILAGKRDGREKNFFGTVCGGCERFFCALRSLIKPFSMLNSAANGTYREIVIGVGDCKSRSAGKDSAGLSPSLLLQHTARNFLEKKKLSSIFFWRMCSERRMR